MAVRSLLHKLGEHALLCRYERPHHHKARYISHLPRSLDRQRARARPVPHIARGVASGVGPRVRYRRPAPDQGGRGRDLGGSSAGQHYGPGEGRNSGDGKPVIARLKPRRTANREGRVESKAVT
jgi:hypothetical protein